MTNNDIDLCKLAQSPCNALLDAETRIAELTRERDEARDGREARHRAWLEAKARNAELEAALRDAEKRLRGAGMLGGSDDPIAAAIRALKEPVASLRESGLAKPNCPNLEEGKHD
jgi:hypothetical protein